MNFLVYLIHNTINGKYYVGWTSKTFEERWKSHCQCARYGSSWHLSCAIRFHGCDVFKHEILATTSSRKEVQQLEKLWILILEAYKPEIGYNMTTGGDGWHGYDSYTEEQRKILIEKRRLGLKKRWENPTERQLAASSKVSQKLKGRIGHSDVKKNMTHIEYYGVEKAAEIAKKLSEKNLGTKKGVWITNGVKNRVTQLPIPEGWYRGKTQKEYIRTAPVLYSTILKRSESLKRTWERKRKIKQDSPAPVSGVSIEQQFENSREKEILECQFLNSVSTRLAELKPDLIDSNAEMPTRRKQISTIVHRERLSDQALEL